MFGSLFGGKPPAPPASKRDPAQEALARAIEERRKQDPLIGAKIGAKDVLQRLLAGLKGERGVHVESLLCALGSLAGYSCQASLRAIALKQGLKETAAFMTASATDGKQYFFGDPLNNALAGPGYSVWGLVGAAAQDAGAKELPDLNEMFQHTASVMGSPAFGVPRVPANHAAGDAPIGYLKALWPALMPTLKQHCPNPAEWPVLFGIALQEAIGMAKQVIAPEMAVRIVMESAIPMSKVDLANA